MLSISQSVVPPELARRREDGDAAIDAAYRRRLLDRVLLEIRLARMPPRARLASTIAAPSLP